MSDLDAAYRATTYTVMSPDSAVAIRIGVPQPVLDHLMAERLCANTPASWCHITAHNPRSRVLAAQDNEDRNRALEDDLRALQSLFTSDYGRALVWLPGEGRSPDGTWAEAGFWVAGLTAFEARALGARYQQNAVVTGISGGDATLTWVYGQGSPEGWRVEHRAAQAPASDTATRAALHALHGALLCGQSPDSRTVRLLDQPWLHTLEADWELLWWEAQGQHVDLDEIPQIHDFLAGSCGPTSRVCRGFEVGWPDGDRIAVACLVTIDDWGTVHHLATGFGLSTDAALAALRAGSPAITGKSSDLDVTEDEWPDA